MLKKLIESAIKCQRFATLVGKLSPLSSTLKFQIQEEAVPKPKLKSIQPNQLLHQCCATF
jgi:hypothetical protein